jgi:hypothetical protein
MRPRSRLGSDYGISSERGNAAFCMKGEKTIELANPSSVDTRMGNIYGYM